jgi:hypothetical protein
MSCWKLETALAKSKVYVTTTRKQISNKSVA